MLITFTPLEPELKLQTSTTSTIKIGTILKKRLQGWLERPDQQKAIIINQIQINQTHIQFPEACVRGSDNIAYIIIIFSDNMCR